MDDDRSDLVTQPVASQYEMPPQPGRLRCDICQRRVGSDIFFVEETGDVPDGKRAWALCAVCHAAVREQLQASPLQSPLRLRIAVGLVAAERTPEARRANFGQLTDESWVKIFLWLFPITMIVHLLIIVVVAGMFR